jgi:hypothetical protein
MAAMFNLDMALRNASVFLKEPLVSNENILTPAAR